jgi:CPA2 family monovalent cation:H+ antiporter-2
MERIARTRSTELFTLTVFVVALGVALLAAEVFTVSVALGAFFAGMVVGQSRFGPQAAADMVPFRDVFSALFFVSVGMLFTWDRHVACCCLPPHS